jgi:tape measure domain-containing protein
MPSQMTSQLGNINGQLGNMLVNITNVGGHGQVVTNMLLGWSTLSNRLGPSLKNLMGNFMFAFRQAGSSPNAPSVLQYFGGVSGIINNMKGLFAPLAVAGVSAFALITASAVKLGSEIIQIGIKYNAMIEQMKTGYDVMLGSGDKGTSLLNQLRDMANVTPFTLPQLGKGVDQLLGYGVGEGATDQVNQVLSATQMLGDVSRGIPEKFNDIAYAFGQVYSMGRLQGQELRQLINAGWNPLNEISKKTGKSMGELKQDMEDGAISTSMIIQALIDATSEGGRFYKMMEKQSKTGIGMWSTIIDKGTMVAGAVTESLFNSVKGIMGNVIKILQVILDNASILSKIVADNLGGAFTDIFKQVINILGVTNSTGEATLNIIDLVTTWSKGLANLLKIAMAILNIVVFIGSAFGAGLTVVSAGLSALVLVVAAGIDTVALGIVGTFEWAWKKSYNTFVDKLFNPLINGWNDLMVKMGSTELLVGQIERYSDADLSKTWGIKTLKSSLGAISEMLGTIKDTSVAALGTFSTMTVGALGNLFGDTSGVDDFLDTLDKIQSPEFKKVDFTSLLAGATDSTKKSTDELKKLGDSIQGIVDKLVNMGNAFEKLTYEKFSPYKATIRMRRFFEEMQKWVSNLNTLSMAGVPEFMVNNLRSMGVQGYGLTSALAKASKEQRDQIISQYQGAYNTATGIAGKTAAYDYIRDNITINVTGNSIVSPELVNKLTDEIVSKLKRGGV